MKDRHTSQGIANIAKKAGNCYNPGHYNNSKYMESMGLSHHEKTHDNSFIEIQAEFDKQTAIFEEIEKAGSFEKYFESLDDHKGAFYPEDKQEKKICCIDERTYGELHLAGSGILLKEEEAVDFIKKSGATAITSHAGCGAAKLAAQTAGLELDSQGIEQYSKDWSKKISELANIPYIGHLDVVPQEFHISRIAYYDASGRFEPSQIKKLLPGFITNRKYLDTKHAKEEVLIEWSIAAGDHGFGKDRFSRESPFLIIVIVDPSNTDLSFDKLEAEIKEIPEIMSGLDEGYIKLDRLTMKI